MISNSVRAPKDIVPQAIIQPPPKGSFGNYIGIIVLLDVAIFFPPVDCVYTKRAFVGEQNLTPLVNIPILIFMAKS
jgi:hypothetical protein